MNAFSNHVGDELAAYLDGQLPPAELDRVAAHLATCARCREERDEVRFSGTLLRQLPAVSAPDSLWGGIECQIGRPRPGPVSRWFPRPAWGLAAALLGIALVVVWQTLSERQGTENRPASPVASDLDLGAYLGPVKAATIPTSYQAITRAPDSFAPLGFDSNLISPQVIRSEPLEGFRLLAQRAGHAGRGRVVQLVYGNGEEAFSVFVAPLETRFCYGREFAVDAKVEGVLCSKVDCPLQETYAFRAGGSSCALVSKSLGDHRAAAVMRHFMAVL